MASFLAFFRLKPIFFQVCTPCEQLDSQYCATLVAFQRPNATVRYVSGSNCPLLLPCILISFFPSIGSICKIFLLKIFNLLFSQLLPLAAGCDDKMRLADEKNRDQGLSTRRRNRVLTKIHLIYSVIHAPAASNEHSKWSSPPSRGRSAGGKIFVPPPIQLLSRGIPPLSPSDSAAFHPNWPPAAPTSTPAPILLPAARIPFLAFGVLMNHRKHERRGLSIFCR